MNTRKLLLILLLVSVVFFMYMIKYVKYRNTPRLSQLTMFPCHTSTQSITPLNNTKHLLVSAYMDRRVKGWDVRIIGIFRGDSIMPLHCVFCCSGNLSIPSTPASFVHHDGFGFPYETMDVMCWIPAGCRATHVTLSTHSDSMEAQRQIFLPIGNQESGGTEAIRPQFDFTVCIPVLYGGYNNVLQFTQALEMYRLLGVDRVAVYNTSCGPDLNRLLHSYSREGFVEIVPWPVDKHLTPSKGWQYQKHGAGDLHYYGQLTTLNDCVYRYMDRSRYVLLHDIDEIIVPYRHNSLISLMSQLQQQNPKAGVFLFQMHLFPADHVDPNATFHLPQWEGVPGINILEHIYREYEMEKKQWEGVPILNILEQVYRKYVVPREVGYKMIVQPRMVQQTSVHKVLKNFGNTFKVPPDVALVMHYRGCLITHTIPPQYRQSCVSKEHMRVDTRLWEFREKLIPSVDKALGRIGMLRERNNLDDAWTQLHTQILPEPDHTRT